MTQFKQGAKIRREVSIAGVDSPVQIEITGAGVEMWVKGSRKRTVIGWSAIARHSNTSQDVPSFLMDKPLELLNHQANEARKKSSRP